MNVAFADGHVRWLPMGKVVERSLWLTPEQPDPPDGISG